MISSLALAETTGVRPTRIGYAAPRADPGVVRPRLADAGVALGRAGDDVRQRVAHHHRLPMGSFAFACGRVVVSTEAMPTWLGWWGVVAGIALGLAQFVWTVEAAWLVPYAAFWLWLLTTCVVLVRRTPSAGR